MDEDMKRALQMSVEPGQGKAHDTKYVPPVQERIRLDPEQAVGLRNVGNTCYFNSLLQIYYSLPSFVEKIFCFQEDTQRTQDQSEVPKITVKRQKSGLKLIRELKVMFALQAIGNKKYVEPMNVLQSIVDDDGTQI